jgi:HK97 family phage major capsid protein
MGDQMLTGLVDERTDRVRLIETVRQNALESQRDLSDQDKTTIDMARKRIEEIDGQLEYVADSYELDETVRARLARAHPGDISAPHQYRSFGEIAWDALHRSTDRAARDRYDRLLTRAAQHMGTVAADTTATAGDVAGIIVDPVVGPIVNFTDAARPFLNAIGTTQVAAYDFRRPYISDGAVAAGTTAQTAQKAELPSTAFSVASDTLEMKTYGEYLNISQQLLSFDPQGLGIILGQLRNRVARGTEKAAFTELALSTSKITLSLTAVDATVNTAIWDAIAKVYDETGMPATWILMGPTGAARLGKVADSAGRPLYPAIGPSNAAGQTDAGGPSSVLGLRPIVSYAVTTAAMWVGNSGAFEAYEYPFPMLSADEPSVFGRQVAIATGAAFYRPRSRTGDDGAVQLAP